MATRRASCNDDCQSRVLDYGVSVPPTSGEVRGSGFELLTVAVVGSARRSPHRIPRSEYPLVWRYELSIADRTSG